jgi:hypothetical protein
MRHDGTECVVVRGGVESAVVIEAEVVAGYVIAWAMRKVRRAGGRLDAEVDVVIDAGLDRLHEVVAAKLGAHLVLAQLANETTETGQVSELTRQQLELAITAAARKDEAFGQAVSGLVDQLREAVYRSRTLRMACELRFGRVGGLRQDRGSCLSVCCIWS